MVHLNYTDTSILIRFEHAEKCARLRALTNCRLWFICSPIVLKTKVLVSIHLKDHFQSHDSVLSLEHEVLVGALIEVHVTRPKKSPS